jgi:hypothetical protein
MSQHREFLERFPNAKAAAEAFNTSTIAIGHWKTRGIPARFWPIGEVIAKKEGWPYTALTLSATRPMKVAA